MIEEMLPNRTSGSRTSQRVLRDVGLQLALRCTPEKAQRRPPRKTVLESDRSANAESERERERESNCHA